jgi:hypothetical protein
MFKFVVTIELDDGTTRKKECYSLDEATQWTKENSVSTSLPVHCDGKTKVAVKEIVIRTKPWL